MIENKTLQSNPKKPVILIGFAQALSAPEVFWSINRADYEIILFSRYGIRTPFHRNSKIKIIDVCPPEKNIAQTLSDFRQAIKNFNPDVLMPLDDRAIWVCSKLSDLYNIKNVGPTGLRSCYALDKVLQIEKASQHGLNAIPSRVIGNVNELLSIDNFPVLIKPAKAAFEKDGKLVTGKHFICSDNAEIAEIAKTWNGDYDLLAQPVIDGVGEGIFGLMTEQGVLAWSAHKRIRMMNPLGSGSSACQSIQVGDHPLEQSGQMLSDIKWRGLFMIEFIRDRNDKLWFMEMNGRPWGSMALARRRGYEYPLWSVKYSLDPLFKPDPPKHFEDMVCRHLGREILHLFMVIRGPQSSAVKRWPSVASTLSKLLTFNSNQSWYNLDERSYLFFIEDTLQTVFNIFIKKLRNS